MEKNTLEIYEPYFKNDNWRFSLSELTFFLASNKKMNGIIDTYEFYFSNLTSFHFDFNKRK